MLFGQSKNSFYRVFGIHFKGIQKVLSFDYKDRMKMIEQLKNAIINLGAIITSCSLAYSLTSEKLGYVMIPVLLILFFAFLPLLLRLFTFGFYGTFKVNDDK